MKGYINKVIETLKAGVIIALIGGVICLISALIKSFR
jgi:hypothetical protein